VSVYSLDQSVQLPEDGNCWIAPNATVIGNVRVGSEASVWFGTVIRGDNELIDIGARTNIQEGCVLHTDPGYPMTLAEGVTVGHMVMLHGCTIGARSLVGIGSIILNGTTIGEECLIGANTLIPEGKTIPPHSMVLGSPGRIVKTLDDAAVARIAATADRYVENWKRFRERLKDQEQ